MTSLLRRGAVVVALCLLADRVRVRRRTRLRQGRFRLDCQLARGKPRRHRPADRAGCRRLLPPGRFAHLCHRPRDLRPRSAWLRPDKRGVAVCVHRSADPFASRTRPPAWGRDRRCAGLGTELPGGEHGGPLDQRSHRVGAGVMGPCGGIRLAPRSPLCLPRSVRCWRCGQKRKDSSSPQSSRSGPSSTVALPRCLCGRA